MIRGKMKSYTMLLLAAVLLLTVIGCSSGNSNNNDKASPSPSSSTAPSSSAPQEDKVLNAQSFPLENPVTMTVFSWYGGHDYDPNHPQVKEFERLTNVKLDFNAPADGYDEKLSLLLQSNTKEWPDILLLGPAGGRTVTEISLDYGNAGKFVNYKDYLDRLPNVKKYFEENPEARGWFENENGDIYLFPYIYSNRNVPIGFHYNAKAYETAGISGAPTSLEELYEHAKKLKEAFPKSYPVTSYTIPSTLDDWSWLFKTRPLIFFNEERGQYEYGPLTPEYLDMLKYLNKLYSEKLYDPQFSSYKFADDNWKQTLASGNSFITPGYINAMKDGSYPEMSVNDLAKDLNLQDKVSFKYLPPLSYNGKTGKYFGLTTVNEWYGMAIKADSPYVNEALALLDWQLGEQYFNVKNYGIEGTTYTMQDGKPVFMDDVTSKNEEGKRNLNDYVSGYAGVPIYAIQMDGASAVAAIENYAGRSMEDMYEYASWPVSWSVRFDQSTKDKQALATTPAETLVNEMAYKLITGAESFDNYESKVINVLKGYGIEEVIADYNKYYEENVKK